MKQFDHERLNVYGKALEFVEWTDVLRQTVPKNIAAHKQLDRSSTSIPLNIAEGNGKFTPPDRCRFFDIARGSALESAACIDVLVARSKTTTNHAAEGKAILLDIVAMLVGLIRANSDSRKV